MVPRRVIPHILVQHALHERDLALPHLCAIEVREDPLPVAPRVVVLRIDGERVLDERQLRRGLVEQCDEQPAVVPHLICLQEGLGERVGERELGGEGGGCGEEGLVAVLPMM